MAINLHEFKVGRVVECKDGLCHIDGFAFNSAKEILVILKCPKLMAINSFRGYEFKAIHPSKFEIIKDKIYCNLELQ